MNENERGDPPNGYRVLLKTDGQWAYWAEGIGGIETAPTREAAVDACWRHRDLVVSSIPELLQKLCAACGYPKDLESPAYDQEPPIVRGALDAQADAERRLFDVLAQVPALSNMTVAQIREALFPQRSGEDEEHDSSKQAWIENAAKGCKCCSACYERPCAACLAGGVCDAFPCHCDDNPASDDDDADDEAVSAAFDLDTGRTPSGHEW